MAARIGSVNLPEARGRPELGVGGGLQYLHDYEARYNQSYLTINLMTKIHQCDGAASLLLNSEKELYSLGILSDDKPSLQSLEKGLLDLCYKNLTDGIFYYLCVKYQDKVYARYIESGCYDGLMSTVKEKIKTQHSLSNLSLLKVFTATDIVQAEQKETARSTQQYKCLLGKNKSSVVNQLTLLKKYFIEHQSSDFQLLSMVVHCLKKCANPSAQDDRYIFVCPDESAGDSFWNDTFTNFIVSGHRNENNTDMLNLISNDSLNPMSIQEQFEFISNLSNNHWVSFLKLDGTLSKGHVSFAQHLLYQKGDQVDDDDERMCNHKYYPTSLRNRLLYFSFFDRADYLTLMCKHYIEDLNKSPVSNDNSEQVTTTDFVEPIRKRRKYTPRVVKITPSMLDCSITKNVSVKRSLYTVFRERLITDGLLMWRSTFENGGVFLMNNYSTESGHLLPLSFVHVTYTVTGDNLLFHCTCQMYSYLQGINNTDISDMHDVILDATFTCMHCRFAVEFLSPMCLKTNEMPPASVSKKIQANNNHFNVGVAVLQPASKGSIIKMSVKGQEGTCSFVHLSACGRFVSCNLGACEVLMGNKKKTVKLLKLTENEKVCEHLQVLHSCQEVWTLYLPSMPHATETGQEHSEENRDDTNIVTNIQQGHFDTSTNTWNFGGVSTHKPYPDLDITLSSHIRGRAKLQDGYLARDSDYYLEGHKLFPPKPDKCQCGAGYSDDMVEMYITRLFTRYGVVRTQVYARDCLNQTCRIEYSGDQDAIFQWSKEVCAGDEIGWDFVSRVISSKISFTAYVNDMTRIYQSNFFMSPSFMSVNTFVSWFFSWIASMKIDFRSEIDPWCKHSPKLLAGDGTHVGVAVKFLDKELAIEKPELPVNEKPLHKRFDRVFLPYSENVTELVRQSRLHLLWLSKKALSIPVDSLTDQDLQERNAMLLSMSLDERIRKVLVSFIERSYNQQVIHKLAHVLKALCADAPVIAFLPWRYHEEMINVLTDLRTNRIFHGTNIFKTVAPEFFTLLNEAVVYGVIDDISRFVEYLILFIKRVHEGDRPSQCPQAIPGTYNPEKGIAYYFTEHGCQVRTSPNYVINGKSGFDDCPEVDICNKLYPAVSRGGYSYIFLWFCPIHGHSYGFHLISGSEGRKDPFFSLYKYLPNPPHEVFYDFACGLSEYSLNRVPDYSKSIRFWHDLFHGFGHKCPFCYRSARLNSLNLANSEICEQFNAFIQCIKYTASHLTQSHFCLFMQFFIYVWNKRKTLVHQKKIELALACAV